MMSVNKKAVSIFALTVALVGCGAPPGGKDGGSKDGGCESDSDCPDKNLFFCNSNTYACEAQCNTKEDCSDAKRGQYAIPECGAGRGCECDALRCVPALCSADSDCDTTQVCRTGACVAAPAASTVTKCVISPDAVLLNVDGKNKFAVTAWSMEGGKEVPVVVKTGISWTANDPSVELDAASTTASAVFKGKAPTTGTVAQAIKATVGSVSCYAAATVVSATAAAGEIVVLVSDELSGRPVTSFTVTVTDPTSGAVLGTKASTDPTGKATVTFTGSPAKVNVNVFSQDYNYLTYVGYPTSGTRVLSFVVRRNPLDKYGGYKGTYTSVPNSSNVHVGISGMSLPGSLTDLSFEQLLGPSVNTNVKIGSIFSRDNVPLPAGIYLGFIANKIKDSFAALGLAGTCAAPTATSKPDDGTCGTRSAWSLAGDVTTTDITGVIPEFTSGLSNINYGNILSKLIPAFKAFNSSVVRDVPFSLKALSKKTDGTYDFSNQSFFTAQDHVFNQVPLAFNFVTEVPKLPKFRNTFADAVVLLGGAIVPGRGVVPLGLGVGINDKGLDDLTDIQSPLTKQGLIQMRMAPTHHGIEGSDYGIVALALSLNAATQGNGGLIMSGLLTRPTNNKLMFDPSGASALKLKGAFPLFPEGVKYNYLTTTVNGVSARSIKFPASPDLSDASVIRVVFTNENDKRWVVYLDPSDKLTGFRMPNPPSGFSDRTYSNDAVGTPDPNTDSRSLLVVQTVRLNSDPLAPDAPNRISMQKLVEANDINGDRVLDFTTAFSVVDYSRPFIAWTLPLASGTTIQKGSAITFKVNNFKIGTGTEDEGVVKVFFEGATTPANCPTQTLSTDASGKGEMTVTVGPSCTGASVTLRAQLFEKDSTTIVKPIVSYAISNTTIN